MMDSHMAKLFCPSQEMGEVGVVEGDFFMKHSHIHHYLS